MQKFTLVLLALCLGASPQTGLHTCYWILQGPRLEAEAMATDAAGRSFFERQKCAVLYPVIAHIPPPPGWNVIPWRKYTSFTTFLSDIESGTVPPGTKVVGYDAESWPQTPPDEQADPVGFTIKFARLAHAHGYQVIVTPAINLMQRMFVGENKYEAFVRFKMASAVAPYVDFYHIQAQGLQQNIDGPAPSYASFVRDIAAQVRAANPRAVVTAGISTNTPGAKRRTNPADLVAAVRVSKGLVDGYWLNVVHGDVATASAALSQLPAP